MDAETEADTVEGGTNVLSRNKFDWLYREVNMKTNIDKKNAQVLLNKLWVSCGVHKILCFSFYHLIVN